jgi:fucose permease
MSALWATTGVFFVNGAVVGTWVAQIPWIQDRFDLSSGEVGLVLMGMSLAVIVTMPLAGEAISRFGSVRVIWAGGLASVAAVNLPVLVPHVLLVVVALFVLGMTVASMDVAMNAHGVQVERRGGRPIMSSLHAGWSFGGMIGSGFAAVLAAIGLDARVAVAIASVGLLAALVAFTRSVGEGSAVEQESRKVLSLPPRAVVLLAVLCLLTMVIEGAMGDWGGLYLRRDLGADAALAAAAFAFFTGGMTVGRLVGDAVNARIGAVALLRYGAMLTALPLALMLLVAEPAAAVVGLFVIGLGVANGVPLMYSAAGRRPGVPSGPAIAAVSSMGSLGFLAGPPFIGFIAEATSLPWALATLVLGALAVFVLARRAAGQ